MKRNSLYYVIVVLGIGLVLAGFGLLRFLFDDAGSMSVFPYLMIGLGCGIFGHGMGNLINSRIMSNRPDIKKQMEIEQKDERHIAIQSQAKAKAYDLMIFVFGALMIALALMNVDMMVILMLVSCYLFVIVYSVYCRVKYEKEM